MKTFLRFLILQINGIFPFFYYLLPALRNFNLFRGIFSYWKDYFTYKKMSKNFNTPFSINLLNTYPLLYDRYENAAKISRHYFFQDLWTARKVYESKVEEHYDIGSRLDGFIANCLSFTKVIMLDIRPLNITIPNLTFLQCDCTNMQNIASNSIESLSSLHAIEHFGLGRYGDPVDPEGYLKAIMEIKRVLKKKGNLYISLPIGKQRLEFNAHRIFDPYYVLELFKELQLVEFSAINDENFLITNAKLEDFRNAIFSCGLFHFRKE